MYSLINRMKRIDLLLILADILHRKEKEPVRRVLQQRRREPVDEARRVSLLAFEHFLEGTLDQFLRRNGYRQIDRQLAEVRRQTEQSGIHRSRRHHRNMHIIRLELVPERFGEIIDERLGGIVGLNTRHRHPCGHATHI